MDHALRNLTGESAVRSPRVRGRHRDDAVLLREEDLPAVRDEVEARDPSLWGFLSDLEGRPVHPALTHKFPIHIMLSRLGGIEPHLDSPCVSVLFNGKLVLDFGLRCIGQAGVGEEPRFQDKGLSNPVPDNNGVSGGLGSVFVRLRQAAELGWVLGVGSLRALTL